MDILDYALLNLKTEMRKVLSYKPDLIVLPEFCDALGGMSGDEWY